MLGVETVTGPEVEQTRKAGLERNRIFISGAFIHSFLPGDIQGPLVSHQLLLAMEDVKWKSRRNLQLREALAQSSNSNPVIPYHWTGLVTSDFYTSTFLSVKSRELELLPHSFVRKIAWDNLKKVLWPDSMTL